jgi:hypothetical protein
LLCHGGIVAAPKPPVSPSYTSRSKPIREPHTWRTAGSPARLR